MTVALLGGCSEPDSGTPRLVWSSGTDVFADCGSAVDLLFVVDDSTSMADGRVNLVVRMEELVRALVLPPDADGNGVPDWAPLPDLRVAVVTTDMGAPGANECPDPDGDDAVFADGGWLQWHDDEPDLDFPAAVASLADVGTDGCEFERPLDAIARVLERGAEESRLIRRTARLAVVVVTDEDDCSAADPAVYERPGGPTTTSCGDDADLLRPVADLVELVLAQRPHRPGLVSALAIAGVPPDLVELSEAELMSDHLQTTEDFDLVLQDPRMAPDAAVACSAPFLGDAAPSRRLVEWVRDVNRAATTGIVQSICQSDWTPVARSLTRLVGAGISGPCLGVPLQGEGGLPAATGEHVPCVVVETIWQGETCGLGRIALGEEEGWPTCVACQLGDGDPGHETGPSGEDLRPCAGTATGWFYTTEDRACGGAGRIAFTDDVYACGRMRLECAWEMEPVDL